MNLLYIVCITKKRKTRWQLGFLPSHCVSRLIKVCNGVDK